MMTYDTAKSICLYPRLAIEFKYKTYILEGKTGFCYFFLKKRWSPEGVTHLKSQFKNLGPICTLRQF